MKIEELCIGDLVLVHKPTCKGHRVDYINEMEEGIGADGEIYDVCDIKPIPLTPEILEKNGFEKLDFSHFQIGDRRLVLDADGRWDGPLSWHWVVTEMDTNAKGQPVVLDYYVATINYVHELQHALRICGITKEIQI